MAYIMGDRNQTTLFPPTIEDYVGLEYPVRVYDAFVENIDFQEMGLPIHTCKAGAHEYHPKTMLKLIVYGYSYGIRGSRKLERACHHNVSFMWLVSGVQPDYRTIARFRRENKEAIKKGMNIFALKVKRFLRRESRFQMRGKYATRQRVKSVAVAGILVFVPETRMADA